MFLVATAVTIWAVLEKGLSQDALFTVLIISMSIWGVAGGIFNGPMQALFADSIPKGDRSYWYTWSFAAYLVPSIAGPILAIVLFRVYGDKWTFDEMRPVFLVGLSLEVLPALLAWLLRDSLAVKEEEEEEDDAPPASTVSLSSHGSLNSPAAAPPTEQRRTSCCGYLTQASIPYVLFISGLFTALGSGMTIKVQNIIIPVYEYVCVFEARVNPHDT